MPARALVVDRRALAVGATIADEGAPEAIRGEVGGGGPPASEQPLLGHIAELGGEALDVDGVEDEAVDEERLLCAVFAEGPPGGIVL